MNILVSTWICYFATFFLACLGCGLLLRRGFVPLHLSALVGVSAYVFAAGCGKGGLHPAAAATISLIVVIGVATVTGLVFLRVRKSAAALITISMQLIFERYVSTAEWTGGSSGISQGIPLSSPEMKIAISIVTVFICCLIYNAFRKTSASRLLITDGYNPLLVMSTVPSKPLVSLLVANIAVGICTSGAGILLALQTGFVAPASFSLNWALLYAGTILLVGWQNLKAIAVGTFILTLLPEILRYSGLGQASISAWRGVIVGTIIAIVVWAQFPRMISVNKHLQMHDTVSGGE